MSGSFGPDYRLSEQKKSEYRGLAISLSLVHLPNALTYEEYVGIELNQDLLELRAAYRVYTGIRMFYHRGPVPREWLEAVCESEEQVNRLLWKSETESMVRKAYDKLGRR